MNDKTFFLSGKIDSGILRIEASTLPNSRNLRKAFVILIKKAKKLGAVSASMFVDSFMPGAQIICDYIARRNGAQLWSDGRFIEYEWII